MIDDLILFLKNDNLNLFLVVMALLSFLYGSYNKIKYSCLEKASKLVTEVESLDNLTGQQKFALVTVWINDELPKIFKISIFQTILEKIIQFAYNTSFDYMKNYVKRKTGQDVSQVISSINTESAIKDDNN